MKREVVYTDDFLTSLGNAVHYISYQLGMPKSAKKMAEGVYSLVHTTSYNPEIAVKREFYTGDVYYVVSYKKWNIYYEFDNSTMYIIGLFHQNQNH